MMSLCVKTSRRIFVVDTRHVYPYRRLYMDDQLIEVFVPIRQSEQRTVDRLYIKVNDLFESIKIGC
jgi:hypothetical protein